jgi:hypothetical protein
MSVQSEADLVAAYRRFKRANDIANAREQMEAAFRAYERAIDAYHAALAAQSAARLSGEEGRAA